MAAFSQNLSKGSCFFATNAVIFESARKLSGFAKVSRNTMDNRLTQIFVRTGLCPERKVIDQYDINGYFTKMEATEDKLYSLIKSSVRQYLAFGMSSDTLNLITQLLDASGSRRQIRYVLSSVCGEVPEGKTPRWIMIDGVLINPPEEEPLHNGTMKILLSHIMQDEGLLLNPEVDRYISDNHGSHLIHVSANSNRSEVAFLFVSQFDPPMPLVEMMHALTHALATVWKQSQDN